MYEYCSDNETINFKAEITSQELGDAVQVHTGFKGIKTGIIRRLDFRFSRHKMIAEVTVG